MKLVTYHFHVIKNFDNYVGTQFPETHLIDSDKCPMKWALENLPKYFAPHSDFKLIEIQEES